MKHSINCVVVDDESSAIDIIDRYISRTPELHLFASFTNAKEAIEFIEGNIAEIDVLILDISMPEFDGIDLMEMFGKRINFIIASGFSEQAHWGFEYNAVDFLHKPYSYERFMVAINKFLLTIPS